MSGVQFSTLQSFLEYPAKQRHTYLNLLAKPRNHVLTPWALCVSLPTSPALRVRSPNVISGQPCTAGMPALSSLAQSPSVQWRPPRRHGIAGGFRAARCGSARAPLTRAEQFSKACECAYFSGRRVRGHGRRVSEVHCLEGDCDASKVVSRMPRAMQGMNFSGWLCKV
jgi:hypothetical protein